MELPFFLRRFLPDCPELTEHLYDAFSFPVHFNKFLLIFSCLESSCGRRFSFEVSRFESGQRFKLFAVGGKGL